MIVNPTTTKIGWIGTGIMGQSMCCHLMNAGYKATIYNRTLSKCDYLKSKGATVVSTPKEVAEQSDIVFSIVGYPKDVKEIVFGENGIIHGIKVYLADSIERFNIL